MDELDTLIPTLELTPDPKRFAWLFEEEYEWAQAYAPRDWLGILDYDLSESAVEWS